MTKNIKHTQIMNKQSTHCYILNFNTGANQQIFEFLNAQDICRLRATCKQLRDQTNGQNLWRKLTIHSFGRSSIKSVLQEGIGIGTSSWFQLYQVFIMFNGKGNLTDYILFLNPVQESPCIS
jgi:hypothetical protein